MEHDALFIDITVMYQGEERAYQIILPAALPHTLKTAMVQAMFHELVPATESVEDSACVFALPPRRR